MMLTVSENIETLPTLADVICRIAPAGGKAMRPAPMFAASSRTEKYHANGGAEGFVMLVADMAVTVQLILPCPVISANFRPSLKSKISVGITVTAVELTLPPGQYGMLEINQDNHAGLPAFSFYLFNDLPDGGRLATADDVCHFAPGFHAHSDLRSAQKKCWHFGPGIHTFEGGKIIFRSDLEVYCDLGAVLRCGAEAVDCDRLRIHGRGVFDGSTLPRPVPPRWQGLAQDAFLRFCRGTDLVIDGPVIYNAPYWCLVPEGVKHGRIANLKTVCWVCNTDALQPRSCEDLLVEHCFFKCDDDCIAIKTRRDFAPVSGNLTFRNIICCNEAASALEIGHSSQGEVLHDITFESIECIRSFWGYCHICLADHAIVRNVKYYDIYIENNQRRVPEISFETTKTEFSSETRCGRIEKVEVTNLYLDSSFRGVKLLGQQNNIADIKVRNVFCNGQKVSSAKFTGSLLTREITNFMWDD